MRGVYAVRSIPKGKILSKEDVYFAMPLQEGQLTSGEFGSLRSTFTATSDYAPNQAVTENPVMNPVLLAREVVHEVKGMISEAGIILGPNVELELSHHYGLAQFRNVGALIVNVCNREYCKKLIVMVPGQKHPRHRHEKKEEMFELLSGDIDVELDGEVQTLKPGDQLLVKRNSWHSFFTRGGAIFEEISTTHHRGDSYYEDPAISSLDPMQRKTIIREDDY
jgi:N-acetylneuraminate synthase